MANNKAENVSTGKPKVSGAAYVAPIETPIPTDATTVLDATFTNVGYCSEDGLTNSISTDSQEVKAWGGDTVMYAQTGRTETFNLSLLEINQTTLEQVFGSQNVTADPNAITAIGNSIERDQYVWVFELLLSAGRIMRTVVPAAKITEIGDISYVDGDPIKFDLTISALPDSSGNTSYRYIAKAV